MPGFSASLLSKSNENLGDFTAGDVCFSNDVGFSFEQNLKAQRKNIAIERLERDGIVITLWGDIFSIAGIDCKAADALNEIHLHYNDNTLKAFLANVNGYFIISIIDFNTEQVTLISDRYGMKPLYLWMQEDTLLGYASEIKELLNLQTSEVSIDLASLNTFIDIGHCLGNTTLFKQIKRLEPAAILRVSLKSRTTELVRYWSWNDIQPLEGISFDDAVSKLGLLFDQAMRRAISTITQDKLAITLSGGLDSRALLAGAAKYFKGDIHTFTFGEAGCADHVIAKHVSDLASATHHFIGIDGEKWFCGRERGVWLTDGLKNVLHMHALTSVAEIAKHSNYLLNGFLGDVTAGGSYIPSETDKENVFSIVKQKYGKHFSIALADEGYFDFDCEESIFIYNRGMRFIAAGSDLLSHELHQLKPFMDNDFVDFLYGLPSAFRKDGKLYHHMLLDTYPEYFSDIPWQQTGKPISKSQSAKNSSSGMKSTLKAFIIGTPVERWARSLYRRVFAKHHYVAYDLWLREPKFESYVYDLLLTDSHLSKILSCSEIKHYIDAFYRSKKPIKPEIIGSLITVELFLRQLNDKGFKLGSSYDL
ncbi:asparagine synthase-related protein [Pseudoalteromonas piscicida]|uniref:asparagine synthase (glutamine-hydrolyzing) n=1 Tax=Pseudoalteromonas piscicida TaxID=43662 RepID=A0ABM6NJF9_PSEO7|nr:asparagine synthetase B family protein [Pseudoalteromonas piscicida]ATD08940.1 hypothetical protein PPIS_a4291 [Pseudoalteromonas piscicida]WPU30923.1 asparagine synthase-related protein [Pseudoalteromonas piscicida]